MEFSKWPSRHFAVDNGDRNAEVAIVLRRIAEGLVATADLLEGKPNLRQICELTPLRAIGSIQEAVAARFGISLNEMLGPRRDGEICRARHLAMWLCRQVLDAPYMEIAKRFGKDHTTVMHGFQKIQAELNENSTHSNFVRGELTMIVSGLGFPVPFPLS